MANSITQARIDGIFNASQTVITTMGEKTTVAVCTLPCGFVIVESSSCVDPINYSQDLGMEICVERIKNKLWELEGYRLQCEVSGW